jgi:hypothetical protein
MYIYPSQLFNLRSMPNVNFAVDIRTGPIALDREFFVGFRFAASIITRILALHGYA